MIMQPGTRTQTVNAEDVNVGNAIVVPNGIAKIVTDISFFGDHIVLDLKGGSTKYVKRGQTVRRVLV